MTGPALCDVLGGGITYPKGDDASNMDCDFVGGARFMTSDEPDPAATFECAARVGTGSTDDPERPMEAMSVAVADMGVTATCNAGFLRDDAILAVVFLTDEDDNEGDGSMGDVASWRQALLDAKQANEAAIVVVGLFGDGDLPNALCPTLGMGGAETSPRLRAFVDSWGAQGLFGSICADSYDAVYADTLDLIGTTCDAFVPGG